MTDRTKYQVVDRVERGLTADPDALTRDDLKALCRGIERIGLERYLRTRWSPPEQKARSPCPFIVNGSRCHALDETPEV